MTKWYIEYYIKQSLWASGTNNKAIDGNFYIIATGTGEGHNLDLDFLKTELKVDALKAGTTRINISVSGKNCNFSTDYS